MLKHRLESVLKFEREYLHYKPSEAEMRFDNTWCEDCGVVHWVEVTQHDTKGRIIKTKCHGKEFLPTSNNIAVNNEKLYTRHRLQGYDVIRKMKSDPKKRLPKVKFTDQPLVIHPLPKRNCVAETSMSVRGQFLTIKVFEDATPDNFYEFFYQVGDKPTMIKPRNLGKSAPVHISEIHRMLTSESNGNTVFHNRQAYEKLITADDVTNILDKNMRVVSASISANQ